MSLDSFFRILPNDAPSKKRKTGDNTSLDRPSPDDIQMLLDHPNANSQPTLNVNKSLSTFLPNFRFPQLHFLGERVEAKWVHDDDYYGLFFNATVTKLHEDGYVDVLFTDDNRVRERVPPSDLKKLTGEQQLSAISPPTQSVNSKKDRTRKTKYASLATVKTENVRREVLNPARFIKEFPNEGFVLEPRLNSMYFC
jgi:hypothetical protein